MIELKPCPFCGGKAVRMIFDPDGAPSGVYCNQCRAFVRWNIETAKHEQFGVAMEKYAEKWNRRESYEAD